MVVLSPIMFPLIALTSAPVILGSLVTYLVRGSGKLTYKTPPDQKKSIAHDRSPAGADGTSPGHAIDAKKATALQKHVMWFDFDKDGIIWPVDTYVGFRKLGFNPVVSFLAPFVIHPAFSWSSGGFPDMRFPIYIEGMHRTKHGSDAEVYNSEGNINHENMDRILAKYDPQGRGGLTWEDIKRMIVDNMNVNDPFGWTAELLEWWAFHVITKDEKGFVSKEKMIAQYDGSLWEMLAEERKGKDVRRP